MVVVTLLKLTAEQRIRHDLIVAVIRRNRRRRALRLMWIRGRGR